MRIRGSRAGPGAAAALVVLLLATSSADATGPIRGIDVSHWNGTISWSRAYAAGQRFVFAKASEASDFVDSRYAGYRSGARAAGFRVGAYHYARPDRGSNDAIHEADHFLATARPVHGDLLPVLDLEDAGTLSASSMRSWAWTWLRRVGSAVGRKPIIYTSNGFWHDAMADTTFFAVAGYRLWIAHYDVSSPSTPAHGWDGHGATLWQYSKCGAVSGLTGCVDLDRFLRTRLAAITIH
jgi:GH25 family lysozyme M1 (1,4-beta-N-acetylmuramidase)